MPYITFYLDKEHWKMHDSLDDKVKKEINGKARKLIYYELDKLLSEF